METKNGLVYRKRCFQNPRYWGAGGPVQKRYNLVIMSVPASASTPEVASAQNLYPIALHLTGRRCVVVGGGAVGERKALGLLDCGAHVVVIAPDLRSDKLYALANAGKIWHIPEPFAPLHLEGASLCVAATDNPAINEAVLFAAHAHNVLCNLAAPALSEANPDGAKAEDRAAMSGDFVTMGTVRRGDLLLAVTTGGAGPSLAARIKQGWEDEYGPEWETYVRLLREMRERVQADGNLSEIDRAGALRRLVQTESIREKLASDDEAEARADALAAIAAPEEVPWD